MGANKMISLRVNEIFNYLHANDEELLKKCHQCMEIIVSAKDRQAAEANKNANILLEEIDAERSREESKKAAAARKREKKRQKKKEKQEREREQKEKETKKDDTSRDSKSCSPEPEDEQKCNELDENTRSSSSPENEQATKNVSTESSSSTQRNNANAVISKNSGTVGSDDNKNRKPTSNDAPSNNASLNNANKKNTKKGTSSSSVNLRTPVTHDLETEKERDGFKSNERNGASGAPICNSRDVKGAKRRGKERDRDRASSSAASKVKENKDRNTAASAAAAPLPSPTSGLSNINTDSAKTSVSSDTKKNLNNCTAAPVGPNVSTTAVKEGNVEKKPMSANSRGGTAKSEDEANKKAEIPKFSNTGIGDLDDFGMLPPGIKVTPTKEAKEKKTSEKNSRVGSLDNFGLPSLSPAKTGALKSPGGPSPKRGPRKEEGWKEVIRKSKKVIVPSSTISRVIGRSGSNINAIREVSGANIDIDKATKNSGDRTITIKGSADATRQAHNLIMALIKDPDKELEQIIPKLKNRVINTNTLTISSSVWHNSMANGVTITTASGAVLTVTTGTMTAPSGNKKGSTSKAGSHGNAMTKANGISSSVTTTVTQATSGWSSNGSTSSAGGRNMQQQSSTMTNIGVFQLPIGVWNPAMAAAATTTSNSLKTNGAARSSSVNFSMGAGAAQPAAPARSPSMVARQLFPKEKEQSINASSVNASSAKSAMTYASPSMAKTKLVMTASPAVASRIDTSKGSTQSLTRSQSSSRASGSSPSRVPHGPSPLNTASPMFMSNKSEPQPLPIKTNPGQPSGGMPKQSMHPMLQGTGATGLGEYSPFNNAFSPMAERVLGKRDDMPQESKMNFASVAAAGVVTTSAPALSLSAGQSSASPALHGKELDARLQAKAPGYKPPGHPRTVSPQVSESELASKAPGYRGLPPDTEGFGRVPGYPGSQYGMLMNPADRDNLGRMMAMRQQEYADGQQPYLSVGGMNRLNTGNHSKLSPPTGQPGNLSPQSPSAPNSLQSSRHSLDLQQQFGGFVGQPHQKDEYTTPDQPMTLPKIESNLNPNAPDFTLRGNVGNVPQHLAIQMQRLYAAQFRQQHQQQEYGSSQAAQQHGSAMGSAAVMPPGGMQLPPFHLLNQQSLIMGEGGPSGPSGMHNPFGTGIPDNQPQPGDFGVSMPYSAAPGSLTDSGLSSISTGSSMSRQYSPLGTSQSAARSASAASSVGTSSKGEGSPGPAVSTESSPLSSSAPSPTDNIRPYTDEGHQPCPMRPIGTERSGNKKERQSQQQYGGMTDSTAAAAHLWGLAADLAPDWIPNSASLMTSSVISSPGLTTRETSEPEEIPRPSSQPAVPQQYLAGVIPVEANVLDPVALDRALQSQAALLVSSSGGLILGGAALPPVPYPPPLGNESHMTTMWGQQPPESFQHHPSSHGSVAVSQEGAPVDPHMMWNSWTPPPNM